MKVVGATAFDLMCEGLTAKIKSSYEEGVTMDEAEKLAGEFLHAQVQVSNELRNADLDARMRKTGVKAVKAACYLDNATKSDKKPSDVMLNALVDDDANVRKEQDSLDMAEVKRNALQNYYDIFREAHIYYRGIAKGKFE